MSSNALTCAQGYPEDPSAGRRTRRVAELPDHLDVRRIAMRPGPSSSHAGQCLACSRRSRSWLSRGRSARTRGRRPVGEAAELEVSAPAHIRGGLFFQGRFTVDAREPIENATLVLGPGWLENMHINTIEPAPLKEASRDGDLALPSVARAATGWSSTCSSR